MRERQRVLGSEDPYKDYPWWRLVITGGIAAAPCLIAALVVAVNGRSQEAFWFLGGALVCVLIYRGIWVTGNGPNSVEPGCIAMTFALVFLFLITGIYKAKECAQQMEQKKQHPPSLIPRNR